MRAEHVPGEWGSWDGGNRVRKEKKINERRKAREKTEKKQRNAWFTERAQRGDGNEEDLGVEEERAEVEW